MTDSVSKPETTAIDLELKKSFRDLFPEYARELDKARTDEEVEALRQRFVQAEAEKLRGVIDEETLAQISGSGGVAYALNPTQYENLTSATGNDIKVQIQTMINTLKVIKSMKSPTKDQIAAQMLATGVGAMAAGIGPFIGALGEDAAVTAAAVAGVEAVSVAGIVGIVTVVIVAALIPIIYFMEKPAACVVVVVNELAGSGEIKLKSTSHVHGKNVQSTPQIPNMHVFPGNKKFVTVGFMVTSKDEDALYGTQSGFVYSYDSTDFAFGIECPLTGLDVDNNCWCGVNQTAEVAAHQTDDQNKQTYTANSSGYRLDINCNSKSGSVAYYIARIRES